MVEALQEEVPSGLRDPPRSTPDPSICPRCLARLFLREHFGWCPTRTEHWRITRFATNTVDQAAEDRLEEANRRALESWLRGGRTMP